MKRAFLFVFAVIAVLVCIAGCKRTGKIIGSSDMAEIYAEMFLADQWVKENPSFRKTADTSLFYEPIFKKYGYSTEDYDRSVHYYLDKPEKYVKVLKSAVDILDKRGETLLNEQDEIDRIIAANRAIRGYSKKNFNVDSLRFAAPGILWRYSLKDSIFADSLKLDSLRLDSLKLDSLRIDSLRRDSLRLDSLSRVACTEKVLKGHVGKRVEALGI